MKFVDCQCNKCESWGGCDYSGTQYYKCEKCSFTTCEGVGSGGKNYKGK